MATRSYKRGNGEGSLTQRPDGRWMARFYITLPSGERRRQHITLKDRDEVMRRMRDEMAKSDKGLDNKTFLCFLNSVIFDTKTLASAIF